MQFLIVVIIAVSLSMDAFSISLVYGINNITKNTIKKISLVVGIFHFIMPLIGYYIGNIVINKFIIDSNLLLFIILFIIGLQMILETFKEEKIKKELNTIEIILFGLAVSIDSLSIGVGLMEIYPNIILTLLTFSIISFSFTYLGLILGKKINDIIGKISTIIGGIILMIVGLLYII